MWRRLVSSSAPWPDLKQEKPNQHRGARPRPGAPWLPCGVTGGSGTPALVGTFERVLVLQPRVYRRVGAEPHSVGSVLAPMGLSPSGEFTLFGVQGGQAPSLWRPQVWG